MGRSTVNRLPARMEGQMQRAWSVDQINCPRLGGMAGKHVRERERDEADGSEETNLLQDLGKHNNKGGCSF